MSKTWCRGQSTTLSRASLSHWISERNHSYRPGLCRHQLLGSAVIAVLLGSSSFVTTHGPSLTRLTLCTLDSSCRVVGKLDNNAGHDDTAVVSFSLTDIFQIGVLLVVGSGQLMPSRWSSIDLTGRTSSNHRFINDIDGDGLVVMLERNSCSVRR